LMRVGLVDIVSIDDAVPPLVAGVSMRLMHFWYAAIGFAVARWIFKRQGMAIADPVTRFRSQGLL
jgi:hypothetical protein